MPSWDNTPQPSSPIPPSYAAPLLNFAPLSEIPQAYFQGADMRQKYDLARAFKDGVPTTNGNPNGPIDYAGVARTLAGFGDTSQLAPLGNVETNRDFLDQSRRLGNSLNPPTNGRAPPPTTPTPVNVTSRNPIPPHGIPPADPNASGDGGATSVVGLADKYGLPADSSVTGLVIGNFAKAVGADPNETLTGDKLARAEQIIPAYAKRNGIPPPTPSAVPSPHVSEGKSAPADNAPLQPPVLTRANEAESEAAVGLAQQFARLSMFETQQANRK